MGYIRHHAIVVTTYSNERAHAAHAVAASIFGDTVSPIIVSSINAYLSFFISTDGSNEGWKESDAGDARREEFIKWLRSQAFDDGSLPYSYVEVQYGDDEYDTHVVNSSDDDARQRTELCEK